MDDLALQRGHRDVDPECGGQLGGPCPTGDHHGAAGHRPLVGDHRPYRAGTGVEVETGRRGVDDPQAPTHRGMT